MMCGIAKVSSQGLGWQEVRELSKLQTRYVNQQFRIGKRCFGLQHLPFDGIIQVEADSAYSSCSIGASRKINRDTCSTLLMIMYVQ